MVIFSSLLEFGGASPKISICEARPRSITRRMDGTTLTSKILVFVLYNMLCTDSWPGSNMHVYCVFVYHTKMRKFLNISYDWIIGIEIISALTLPVGKGGGGVAPFKYVNARPRWLEVSLYYLADFCLLVVLNSQIWTNNFSALVFSFSPGGWL